MYSLLNITAQQTLADTCSECQSKIRFWHIQIVYIFCQSDLEVVWNAIPFGFQSNFYRCVSVRTRWTHKSDFSVFCVTRNATHVDDVKCRVTGVLEFMVPMNLQRLKRKTPKNLHWLIHWFSTVWRRYGGAVDRINTKFALWGRQSWRELIVVTDAYVVTTATHTDLWCGWWCLDSQTRSDHLKITVGESSQNI